MSQIRRDDNMSRTWDTRIEQNIHLPLKSYSPWSPVPLYHQPLSLTQNFHRTVLLCWEGWNISLILFPLSCETHRQFDYNLSNNWWFVIFNCFKIMFQISHSTSDYIWCEIWNMSGKFHLESQQEQNVIMSHHCIRVTIRTTRWRSCERRIPKVRTVPLKYF